MQPIYSQLFTRCIFRDNYGNLSLNFMEICKKQKSLTFNKKFLDPKFRPRLETPFLEVERYDNFLRFNTLPLEHWADKGKEDSYANCLNALIDAFKVPLRQLSGQKVFFSCSAGSDSRIMTAILAKLRDEEGCDFENVLFGCWGSPEAREFKMLMEHFGWKNIYILDDSKPNPYRIGGKTPCVDGFHPYVSQMRFWGDNDPQDSILLSGASGFAAFQTFDEWLHGKDFFLEQGTAEHRMARAFKDACFPYLHPDVLNLCMSLPAEFKNIKDNRINRDKLRTDLCAMLGALDGIPMPTSRYILNITPKLQEKMLDLYYQSVFYRDFKVGIDRQDLFKNVNGFNSCLWSFAVTVYDQLFT